MRKNDWPYQYAIVSIEDCFPDTRYQRPSLPAFVADIVADFRPERVVVLVLSQRSDGRYALLDGQQRWLALKELGHPQVPAVIYTSLAYEDEAVLFASLNFARKNMQPWYLYRALREGNDATVLAVDVIVEGAGFQVGHSIGPEAMIGSPHTLTAIYHADIDVVRSEALSGAEVLQRTLDAVALAWRGTAVSWQQAKTSAMLRGVSRWVSVNPTVPAEALAKALRTVEPNALHQAAKELQQGGSGSGKGRKMEAAIERLFTKVGDTSLRAA